MAIFGHEVLFSRRQIYFNPLPRRLILSGGVVRSRGLCKLCSLLYFRPGRPQGPSRRASPQCRPISVQLTSRSCPFGVEATGNNLPLNVKQKLDPYVSAGTLSVHHHPFHRAHLPAKPCTTDKRVRFPIGVAP